MLFLLVTFCLGGVLYSIIIITQSNHHNRETMLEYIDQAEHMWNITYK
jgi:hypothetical protein